MRFKLLASVTLMTAPFMLFGAYANAVEFGAKFSGFEEVGPLNAETGAIFSPGTGTLDLDLNRSAKTIAFKLTYSGLSAPVTQAHIHFGKEHVPGGIMVWFCGSLTNPGPAGTQTCPAAGGTVTGMITGANVIGPTAQHVTPGDFDALVAALVSDTAYGNIHTMNFPAGEIRGQVRRGDRDDKR
jgi:CHRD domain